MHPNPGPIGKNKPNNFSCFFTYSFLKIKKIGYTDFSLSGPTCYPADIRSLSRASQNGKTLVHNELGHYEKNCYTNQLNYNQLRL